MARLDSRATDGIESERPFAKTPLGQYIPIADIRGDEGVLQQRIVGMRD
jgi:hypothetical protein